MKCVAKEGDVIPTPGNIPLPPADKDAWLDDPIVYEPISNILVDGKKAAVKGAKCTFQFKGTTPPPSNSLVVGNELVYLAAKKTILSEKGQYVLLQDDEKVGMYGNKLKVTKAAGNKLSLS